MLDFGFSMLMEIFGMYKTARQVGEMVDEALSDKENRQNRNNGRGAESLDSVVGSDAAQNAAMFGNNGEKKARAKAPKGEREERKKLLDDLEKSGYTAPDYYLKLSKQVKTTATRNATAAAEQEILAKLNSNELPMSYRLIDAGLSYLEMLAAEARMLQNPPKRPDISRYNYITQFGEIASAYGKYLAGSFKLAMRGRKRTLDLVLDEILGNTGQLQKDVDTALAHSVRVIDGLTAYQEEVIEARITESADEWEKASSAAAKAGGLMQRIQQYREGSDNTEYSTLSTAERNLTRALQHTAARMMASEAVAVHNKATIRTVNSLEGNLRAGMLQLETLSTLVAQQVEDAQYTSQGAQLMKHGYRNAEALGKVVKTVREVLSVRLNEITTAVTSFRNNLAEAQASINSAREGEGAKGTEPPGIGLPTGYARTREEALRIFAERGVKPAQAMLYGISANAGA